MNGLLSNDVSFREVNASVTAGSSIDDNSDIIDMQGFDGVVFITPIADSVNTGVATLTVEQNDANSDTGMTALTGAVASATSASNDDLNNTLLIVDVYRPTKRYLQAVLTSATANIAYGNTIAVLYRGSKLPVTDHATVQSIARVVSPAEA